MGGGAGIAAEAGAEGPETRVHSTSKYFTGLGFNSLRNMAPACSGARRLLSQSKGANKAPEGDETMDYDPIIIITKIWF